MKRRVFVLLTLVGGLGVALAQDPVGAFEQLQARAIAATRSTQAPYLNKSSGKWAQRRFTISELRYDVRRTDSLVSPLVAEVSYLLGANQTTFSATAEEAAQASEMLLPTEIKYRMALKFAYRGERWLLAEGDYAALDGPLRNQRFPLDPLKIEAEPHALTHAPVLHWMR